MKKKMFSVVLLFGFVFTLFACSGSKSSELVGEYYDISEYGEDLEMTIKEDGGGSVGNLAITRVDFEKGQVTVSGDLGEKTFNLEYKDGKVTNPLDDYDIYKKGTKAFDEAIKKRDNEKKEQELKEEKNKKQAESFSKSNELHEIVKYIDTAPVTTNLFVETTKRSGEYVASYVDFDGTQYEVVSEYKIKSDLDSVVRSMYYRYYIRLKDGKLDLSTLSDNIVSELTTDSTYFEDMIRVEDKLKD